ncbi:MAG: Ppx/GppA family phosphatase [Actinomycetia bacterium]|nr:Ppx/GppA family phosphatase [Actinomycetes bacterium]
MLPTKRYGAIDIGTVTTRLLVADVGPDGVREITRRSVITQLGDGWTQTGLLSADGIARVASAVGEFVAEARRLGAGETFGIATSASRDAGNGDEFLEALARVGLKPAIIAGDTEARLSFLGATYGRQGEDILVADVGGGSSELVLGSIGEDGVTRIEAARSIDVGSKRVTELFLHADPPTHRELDAATAYVAEELRPYFDGLRTRPRLMVAVAGTATSLVAIDLALDPYDPARVHGYRLGAHALADMREMLAGMPLERRRAVVGLQPARAGVIVAGALILEMVLAMAGLDSTLVSEHDILYGMLLDRARVAADAADPDR